MAEHETEARILDAAHAVFLRRGTGGARMQEVADEAGVNKALLHYYFRTKDGLAQAVFRRALQSLLPRVLEILESERPLEWKIGEVVRVELEALRSSPFLPGYVLGELTHHPERIHQLFESVTGERVEQMGSRVLSVVGRQLAEAAEAGRLRRLTPEELIMNLLALVMFPVAGRPLLRLVLGRTESEYDALLAERAERLPEFILNAMRP